MPLRTTPTDTWFRRPGRSGSASGATEDVALRREAGELVLRVEMPGFDPADIDCRWADGALRVSAEHVDEERDRERTFHRRFRMPAAVEDEGITAEYENGVLTVRLPVAGAATRGTEIPVER